MASYSSSNSRREDDGSHDGGEEEATTSKSEFVTACASCDLDFAPKGFPLRLCARFCLASPKQKQATSTCYLRLHTHSNHAHLASPGSCLILRPLLAFAFAFIFTFILSSSSRGSNPRIRTVEVSLLAAMKNVIGNVHYVPYSCSGYLLTPGSTTTVTLHSYTNVIRQVHAMWRFH